MNTISGNKKNSIVKDFAVTFLSMTFLFSSSGFATSGGSKSASNGNDSNSNESVSLALPSARSSGDQIIIDENKRGYELENRNHNDCNSAIEQIRAERQKISDACNEISAGHTEQCKEKVDNCSEISGSQSFNSIGSFAQALGVPGNITSAFDPALTSGCPKWSGKDFYDEKKNLEQQIKDTEKELADLNDDRASAQKDYNTAYDDAQKTLADAQKEFDKRKKEMSQEERDRVAEAMKNQVQANKDMRDKGMQILQLRGNVIQMQREKTMKLLAASEAAGKSTCTKAALDYKKSVIAENNANKTAQALGLIRKSSLINQEALRIYTECMATLDNQRIALNETYNQKIDETNKQIENLQQDMTQVKDTLNLADSQLQQIKADADTETKQETDRLTQLMQTTQKQITDAYNIQQQKTQTINAKDQSLQKALNNLNQKLMQMGPPPPQSSTSTPTQVASTIDQAEKNIEDIQSHAPVGCPINGNPNYTNTKGKSKKSKSGGKSGSAGGTK
ncbi:MAG: hypothetical protein ACXVCY_19520 [Pseudobdellovibrionaceae bacterium]